MAFKKLRTTCYNIGRKRPEIAEYLKESVSYLEAAMKEDLNPQDSTTVKDCILRDITQCRIDFIGLSIDKIITPPEIHELLSELDNITEEATGCPVGFMSLYSSSFPYSNYWEIRETSERFYNPVDVMLFYLKADYLDQPIQGLEGFSAEDCLRSLAIEYDVDWNQEYEDIEGELWDTLNLQECLNF